MRETIFVKPQKCPDCGEKNHLLDNGWSNIEIKHYDTYDPDKEFNKKDFYYECNHCHYTWGVKTKTRERRF
ncbi:hypothetical protein KHQ81_12945 [Mycoplasmatota bacterium]|nr:hypothetical protein KHQ81_12945 [Mycoplasmatota bacterium]